MGIMEIIRKWNERRAESKKEFKEKVIDAQQNRKIERTLNEREKSSNERELESHMHEAREAQIKKQLESIRAKKQKESWKGNNFNGKMTMLKDDHPILKEKNIFLDQKSKNPLTQRRMFFK
jgi:hypothetical protein